MSTKHTDVERSMRQRNLTSADILYNFFKNTYLLTHEAEHFLRAANCAAPQELPSTLWNPKVQYRIIRALHWSLSWAISIQSTTSQPISLRSILILSTHLRLGLTSGLLAFPPISYLHSSSPHSYYMSRPFQLSWRDHFNYIWRRVHVMKLLIVQISPTSCHFISLWSKQSPQHRSQTPSVYVPPLISFRMILPNQSRKYAINGIGRWNSHC
jgi:hypothetical protein